MNKVNVMNRSDVRRSVKDCIDAISSIQIHYDLYAKDVDDKLSEALSHLTDADELLRKK